MMSVEIKICGLTNLEDALKAQSLGADYLGFILYKESPRYITPEAVKALLKGLPVEFKAVGVFVNAPRDLVVSTVEECGLYAVQLHGDEDLNDYLPLPVPVWKAVRLSPESVDLPPDAALAERVLVDTAADGLYGGTGKQVDLDAVVRTTESCTVMLGGGMNPDNVAHAIAHVRPAGVDVSSGVEKAPGIKDHALLQAFFEAVRSA